MTVEQKLSIKEELKKFIRDAVSINLASSAFPLMYKGELTHDLTKHFASMTELDLKKAGVSSSTRRKVYHVIIELLQNITHHSDDFQEDNEGHLIGNGLFVIGENQGDYYVVTGNMVANEKIEKLKERLESLNNADEKELKLLFKKQMREGKIDERGGAGLGLIDLIRKTKKKFTYEFIPYDENHQYFINSLTISSEFVKANKES